MIFIKEPILFNWDQGNKYKNYEKHNVTITEVEEVFFDKNKKISEDFFHSDTEDRYIVVGSTKQSRSLFVVFTIRDSFVRVISTRDLNKKEYKLLGKKI